jgi:hypothetical protein
VFDVLERRSLPRRSLNPQPSTINIFQLQNPLPKPPGDVISPRHETEADGTPITESARCGFGKKQNDQKTNLTKIISRSFGCCPSRKTVANWRLKRKLTTH